MEVKPGYKQTEVGVIPEEWKTSTIGSMADTSSGTTPLRALGERYYKNGSVAWVKTLDLNNGLIFATDEQVTQTALNETSLAINPIGTVLVAMYGGFKQIGRTGLLHIPAAVNQAITAVRTDASCLLPEYLLRLLNFRVKYWKTVASSSRKDPNITGREIRDFPIAVPTVSEQEAIAGVLGDADALIESLEQLVAKKRQIKHGAMQELLTGQKRLPGFTGKWEVKRLGDVSRSGSGGTPPSSVQHFYDGEIPWVSIADMTTRGMLIYATERNLTVEGLANSAAQMWPPGTVLYAMYASIGECSIAAIELCSSQAILGIRPAFGLDNLFLYYWLISKKDQVRRIGQQGTQSNLNAGIVKNFHIPLPPRPEQSAIAAILSDMDADIAGLEAKLAKARLVKAGMMQELLTGRIRLV